MFILKKKVDSKVKVEKKTIFLERSHRQDLFLNLVLVMNSVRKKSLQKFRFFFVENSDLVIFFPNKFQNI